MLKTHLIQHIGDIEMPATGRWPVIDGQEVSIRRLRRLRTERSTLRTTAGHLTIGPELIGSTFELALSASEAAQSVNYHYRGHVTEAACWGAWRLTGSWAIDDRDTWSPLLISYRGVYTRGAAPVAWLTISARFRLPGAVRLGRHQSICLAGDLNLLAPPVI